MDVRYGTIAGCNPEMPRNTLGAPVRQPSVEDHVAHIQRANERLARVRASLEVLADRIESRPEAPGKTEGRQSPNDLSGRLAVEAEQLHSQCEYIERQVERIFVSLFSTNNIATQQEKAR